MIERAQIRATIIHVHVHVYVRTYFHVQKCSRLWSSLWLHVHVVYPLKLVCLECFHLPCFALNHFMCTCIYMYISLRLHFHVQGCQWVFPSVRWVLYQMYCSRGSVHTHLYGSRGSVHTRLPVVSFSCSVCAEPCQPGRLPAPESSTTPLSTGRPLLWDQGKHRRYMYMYNVYACVLYMLSLRVKL